MADGLAPDLQETIDKIRAKMEIETLAAKRFSMGSPGMSERSARYREAIKYYAPLNNDQWPEDKMMRPSKIHITANMVKSYCDITARLLSLLPRIINKPITRDLESRKRAEQIEQFFYFLLDQSGWDVWLNDMALIGEIFGISILKPFYNNTTNQPDVMLLQQPQNLIIGYGANDYSVMDWTIYRYTVSFLEAQAQWPNAGIEVDISGNPKVAGVLVDWSTADKADIVDQKGAEQTSPAGGGTADINMDTSRNHQEIYEQEYHLEVWDYWYREDGKIMNAVMVANRIVDGPNEHPELPIIPYLVTEAGHEPGSPEGQSTAILLRDVQMGYNRAITQWAQQVADNVGTAYQVTGPTAADMPEGVVPQSDEYIPVGENKIEPIQRNQNIYPVNELTAHYWELASRLTGIPEILFGQLAGAQTSGRATAAQIEAALNRLDPKRRRIYSTLKDLLRIWGYMASYKNPTIEVTKVEAQSPDGVQAPQFSTEKVKMRDLLKGFDNWKIVAPEITPRDNIEATQNAANKVGAHLSSIESAMDEIGVDDPQHELDLIRQELSDPRLNPGQVQSFISALELLKSLMAQQPNPAAAQNGAAGQNTQMQQNQQAQPTGFQDQNQPGMPTGPGSPPPPGSPAPGGGPLGLQLQGLIRQSGGQAKAMNQIVLPPVKG